MENILTRPSKICEEGFQPNDNLPSLLQEGARILVVGAGGLGCEIVKNLAVLGYKNIHVIDMDTIELSNLNRQFLFREKDIGRFKAEVVHEFIKNKYPDSKIEWSNKKVQEFPMSFFRQFNAIIGGLDNMQARLYLNELVHDLLEYDNNKNVIFDSIIPFVDGGTEGLRGQTRVIIPTKTSCMNCTMDLDSGRKVYALCTIAETPRLPEHCIQYVFIIQWPKEFNREIDKDSVDDVNWVYENALKRAEHFGINGVNYSLTLGVLKNIIPAIASTNAIIAASSVLEVIKILSYGSKILNNNMLYLGHEGLSCRTTEYERDPECQVCCIKLLFKTVLNSITLGELIEDLKNEFGLEDPSLYRGADTLYMTAENFVEHYRPNLAKSLKQLQDEKLLGKKNIIIINDPSFTNKKSAKLRLTIN